jgi:hypothetical protein
VTVRKWNIQSSSMCNVEILLFAFGDENIMCVIILNEYKMCCFWSTKWIFCTLQ